MEDRFETTFVVEMSAADAWKVIATGERSSDRWWLPGFDATTEVVSVEEGRRLHTRKIEQPCAGTEIVVTVEASVSDAKVTVVQSGFDPDFLAAALDAIAIGWSHIVADFILYVERGVPGGRHLRPWAMLGCNLEETPTGLEIGAVWGGFAGSCARGTGRRRCAGAGVRRQQSAAGRARSL